MPNDSDSTQAPQTGAGERGSDCEHEWYKSGERTKITYTGADKSSVLMPLIMTTFTVFRCTKCNETDEIVKMPDYIASLI